ncbi:MAG: riboflavin transporter RibU [Haloplasmataceae bacterium]|jgi:riboflavin transporter FmnP|nr:riboflavin transporter RibU [Haloplasmataceae bacterium]
MSKSYFSTRKLVLLAILSALGSALMWLEIPFIPPFKLDASDSAVIVAAVLYGPLAAFIVAVTKGIAHFIFLSGGDFGIGELIAITASMAYTLPFYFSMKLVKKYSKNIFVIRIIPMIFGTIALSIILPLLNLLVFFQLWSIVMTNSFLDYNDVFIFSMGTIPGNIIKGTGLSIIFFVLSFRLDYVANKLNILKDDEVTLLEIEE